MKFKLVENRLIRPNYIIEDLNTLLHVFKWSVTTIFKDIFFFYIIQWIWVIDIFKHSVTLKVSYPHAFVERFK